MADDPRRGGVGPLYPGLAIVLIAGWTLVAALPGLLRLPPLDRDESRIAQATAQMLDSGDFLTARSEDNLVLKRPVGIDWLQALSVQLASSPEKREISAYRLPSLIGAMSMALACAWGAAPFVSRRASLFAGLGLASTMIVSTEASLALTDAVCAFGVTLSMAALVRRYSAASAPSGNDADARALFWIGQALAIMVGGLTGPVVAGSTLLALWALDRRGGWIRHIGWAWGLLFLAAVIGPWAVAVTVATDGSFWSAARDIEHQPPVGSYLLASPLLLFPATALIPAALVCAWRRRSETLVRFAVAWAAPSWLLLEIAPNRLVHGLLPLAAPLAWLGARAAAGPVCRSSRWGGAVLSALGGAALASLSLALSAHFGGVGSGPWADAGAALFLAAGVAGVIAILPLGATGARPQRPSAPGSSGELVAVSGLAVLNPRLVAAVAAGSLGVAAHDVLLAGLAPRLEPLRFSQRAAGILQTDRLDPRDGLTIGPVALVGAVEPSLAFASGPETEIASPAQGADALAEGQPVWVDQRRADDLRAALARAGVKALQVDALTGYDYADGRWASLSLWRPASVAGGPTGDMQADPGDLVGGPEARPPRSAGAPPPDQGPQHRHEHDQRRQPVG